MIAAAETALNIGIKFNITRKDTLAREAAAVLEDMSRLEKELLSPLCIQG